MKIRDLRNENQTHKFILGVRQQQIEALKKKGLPAERPVRVPTPFSPTVVSLKSS